MTISHWNSINIYWAYYYLSGTVLDTGNILMKQTDKRSHSLWNVIFSQEEENNYIHSCIWGLSIHLYIATDIDKQVIRYKYEYRDRYIARYVRLGMSSIL